MDDVACCSILRYVETQLHSVGNSPGSVLGIDFGTCFWAPEVTKFWGCSRVVLGLFWGCSGVVLGLFWGRYRVLDVRFASRDAVKATLGSFSCWIQWKPSQCPETRGRSAKNQSSRTRYFNYGSSRAREADPPDRAENGRETVRGPKSRETKTLHPLLS